MEVPSDALHVGTILMGLFGGLALFLFGMEQMSDALKAVAGGGMKNALARLTTNRFKAAFAGAFVTAVIQSSSITTVLVVGFISAGLLSLTQSIGIIMGANIGSTVTAQIIAFKVTEYALLLVAVGFGLLFFVRQEKTRHYGTMLMGLGLIFLGMGLMSDATNPLRSYTPFIDMMKQMQNPLLGILVGAAFTAVIQSSAATTGIVIVLGSQGLITLEAGIALALGANIGTCITALLAAIGKPAEALRASVVHILFNVFGVLIWVGLIGQLAELVRALSPVAADLTGQARQAAEMPRQLANAHTLFNVVNTFIFIWLTGPMGKLVERLIPARREEAEQAIELRYLDDILLETPDLALERVRLELGRLGVYTEQMVDHIMEAVTVGSDRDLDALQRMDNQVDGLYAAIVDYLRRLALQNLTDTQSHHIHEGLEIANYLESIGDIVETNLVEVGRQRLRSGVTISPGTQERIAALHDKVRWSVRAAGRAVVSDNPDIANEVADAKEDINALAERAEARIAERLAADEENRLDVYRLESETIEFLKRVYYFSKRIAKVIQEEQEEELLAAD